MLLTGGPFVGVSYFIWNNGILMSLSCIVFTSRLGLLLYRKEGKELMPKVMNKKQINAVRSDIYTR